MSAADWKPYDVPGLAGLLAEQPTDSGTHAMAWQQAYETLTDQRQRIEAARAALTQAWPATPGSAAGSFFDQVDALTQAMSATAESAVNAHGALTGIVTAVDGATTKVDTLHQSWQQNQATIGGVVPTDDWTQPLNDQAHMVMGQADAAIAEHTTQLAPPIPYSPQPSHQTSTPLESGSSHVSGLSSSPTQSSIASSSTSPASSHPLLSAVAGSAVGTGSSWAQSAQSSGRVNGPANSPSPAGLATVTAVARSARFPVNGRNVGTDSEASAGQPSELRSPEQGAISTLEDPNDVLPVATNQMSGLPPTGSGLNRDASSFPRQGSSSSSLISDRLGGSIRPNPQNPGASVHSDSIIAPPSQGRSPSSSFGGSTTNTEAMPIGGMVSGLPSTSGAGTRSNRQNAHVDWPMPVGVSPVLEPAHQAPIVHDPGPGVIGIDR